VFPGESSPGKHAPKSIEMNVLALDHAYHHPTQGFDMTDIFPGVLALTQKSVERIIKAGSGCHGLAKLCDNCLA
jgi:hypothetical protein